MKKFAYIFILLAIPLSLNAYTFTRTLNVGSEGQDVLELQKILNTNEITRISNEGIGSPGNETTYFGEKTKQSVIKLQNLFSDIILKPVGLSVGTGFVGQGTIAFLNEFSSINVNYDARQASVTSANNEELPIVNSVSPESFSGDTKITITGANFSEKNNQIIFAFESRTDYINIPSTDNGTKIEIDFESKIQKVFEERYKKLSSDQRKRVISQFPEIEIAVSVITDAGQSNFKIIKFKLK